MEYTAILLNGRRKELDMDVVAKVRSELGISSLGSEKRHSLQFILGELTNASKGQSGETTLKRLLEENEKALRRTRNRQELQRIDKEIILIRSLLS